MSRRRSGQPGLLEEALDALMDIAREFPWMGITFSGALLIATFVLWRMAGWYPLLAILSGLFSAAMFLAALVGMFLRWRDRGDSNGRDDEGCNAPQPRRPAGSRITGAGRSQPADSKLPYRPRFDFISKGERAFYGALSHAVDGRYLILMKVRLGDLVFTASRKWHWQQKVNQKHVDFVLCDPEQLNPLLVIELYDRSHQEPDRQQRDAFVDQVLQCANLPILHCPTQQAYDVVSLREAIERTIGRLGGGG